MSAVALNGHEPELIDLEHSPGIRIVERRVASPKIEGRKRTFEMLAGGRDSFLRVHFDEWAEHAKLAAAFEEAESLAAARGLRVVNALPTEDDLRKSRERRDAEIERQTKEEAKALIEDPERYEVMKRAEDLGIRVVGAEEPAPEVEGESGTRPLPIVENAALRLERHKEATPPVQLIEGLLHVTERLLFSGASKSAKTWAVIDLAVSVANGLPFWEMPTREGRVLYLNYELGEYHFNDRLAAILRARKAHAGNIDVLPLQKHWGDFERVRDHVLATLEDAKSHGAPYALVVIDPLYSLLEGKNENDNAEMARMMNDVGSIAFESGAAIVMVHHFAKGNSAAKSSIDRASGAGALARYPDAIVTLDRHQEGNGRVAEFTLRNFPERDKLALRFEHPLLVPDEDLDAERIEGTRTGTEPKASLPEFVALAYELGNEGDEIKVSDLRKLGAERFGYADPESSTLYDFVRDAKRTGRLLEAGRGMVRIPPEGKYKLKGE